MTEMPSMPDTVMVKGCCGDVLINEECGCAPVVDHSKCDNAYKPVKCDRCGREYVCTPANDFYCAAEGDHCCEPCLLGGIPIFIPYERTHR